jgi:CheY-like chemotaxis protein
MVDISPSSEPTLAVAEADAVVRNSVIRALKDDFKLVITAPAGSGKIAQLMAVDLVIYDLTLGIRDLESLREKYPEMPIVVITAKWPTTVLDQAIELGKTDFITKPVDGKELKIRVNQCLRRWRFYKSDGEKQGEQTEMSPPSFAAGRKLAGSIEVLMPELHSPSGRMNAAAIAKFLDVPLSEVAAALHINYAALHKTPDSPSAQPTLVLFKHILVILTDMLGGRTIVRAWLNSPHPDLKNRTPISVMLDGHADAVLTILENALAGVHS